MSIRLLADEAEWLEADGLGGFASGTASGVRTRRYHRAAGAGDYSVARPSGGSGP
jgi:Glycogen debranching enzyme N terminal